MKIKALFCGLFCAVICCCSVVLVGCKEEQAVPDLGGFVETLPAGSAVDWVAFTESQKENFGIDGFSFPTGFSKSMIEEGNASFKAFFAGDIELGEMKEFVCILADEIKGAVGEVWFNASANVDEEGYVLKGKTPAVKYFVSQLVDDETEQKKDVFNLTVFYRLNDDGDTIKASMTIVGEPVVVDERLYATTGLLIDFCLEPTVDIPEEQPEDGLEDQSLAELVGDLFVGETKVQLPNLGLVSSYSVKQKNKNLVSVESVMSKANYLSLVQSFGDEFHKSNFDGRFSAVGFFDSDLNSGCSVCVFVNITFDGGIVSFEIEKWIESNEYIFAGVSEIGYRNQNGTHELVGGQNSFVVNYEDGNKTKFEFDAETGLYVKHQKLLGQAEWSSVDGLYTQRLVLNEIFVEDYFERMNVTSDDEFSWFNTNDNVVAGTVCRVYRKVSVQGGVQKQWRVLLAGRLVMKMTYHNGVANSTLFEILDLH